MLSGDSFSWEDEKVLELLGVMVHSSVNVLNATELRT